MTEILLLNVGVAEAHDGFEGGLGEVGGGLDCLEDGLHEEHGLVVDDVALVTCCVALHSGQDGDLIFVDLSFN